MFNLFNDKCDHVFTIGFFLQGNLWQKIKIKMFDMYKGFFFWKNGLESPFYEKYEYKVAIFREWVPTSCQIIGKILFFDFLV